LPDLVRTFYRAEKHCVPVTTEISVRNLLQTMSIEQEIASWDGKSAADIKAIYDACNLDGNFSDTIISLSLTEDCQKGATWLMKAWLEAGNKFERTQIAKIYGALDVNGHLF